MGRWQRTADLEQALRNITHELKRAGIPYAIIGALALGEHGYSRATTDIDLLLTREGLDALKGRVLGLGFVEKFPGSRSLRDTKANVPIDIVLAGDFPGDGKPKDIAFPDPEQVAEPRSAGAFIRLPALIELKLASGLSAPHRLRDLADVLELVRAAQLPETLASRLHPSVRDKYLELWKAAQVQEPE